jgi:hypothetical protein
LATMELRRRRTVRQATQIIEVVGTLSHRLKSVLGSRYSELLVLIFPSG